METIVRSAKFADAKTQAEFLADAAKKQVGELRAARAAVVAAHANTIRTARNEKGEIDWGKVENYKGKTPDECLQAFREEADQLALYGKAIEIALESDGYVSALEDDEKELIQRVAAGAADAAPDLDFAGALASEYEQRGRAPFTASLKGDLFSVMGRARRENILATTMTTSAGWAPEVTRSGYLEREQRRPQSLLDMLTFMPVQDGGYAYMKETAIATNPAANVSEGGAYAEATFAYTEETANTVKIGVYLPVTDEQLSDVMGIRSLIEMRLPLLTREKLEQQILNGSGTAPQANGILNATGVGSVAKTGDDTILDIFAKAVQNIYTNAFEFPSFLCLRYQDYHQIITAKDTDGRYLYGDPSGFRGASLWGVPVSVSQALPANTALMGSNMHHFVGTSSGIDVQLGMINDNFIKGVQCFRCQVRAQSYLLRPSAFCKITALNTATT